MLVYDVSMLNAPIDVSREFTKVENIYFHSARIKSIEAEGLSGKIEWKRYGRKLRTSFNQVLFPFEKSIAWEFPPDYGEDKNLPFAVSFVSPRTIRIRMAAKSDTLKETPSLILDRVGTDDSWEVINNGQATICRNSWGTLTISHDPLQFQVWDREGKLLTESLHIHNVKSLINCNPMPFSFVRRASDLKRFMAATFSLAPDEGIYGCGESFTRLNKRGQRLVMWATDPKGAQTPEMYKPVPFFISSRGYGMFVHTSAPLTLDFGCSYDGASTIYLGDELLDLFIFLGEPKEVLSEYTSLTGRSPLPPLWSFGLWMGRISYKSEQEVRNVANQLRNYEIPCDVIHLDTGWFEHEWLCDFEFAKTKFDDPKQMIEDLHANGFELSLWQIPYFTPSNRLYREAIDKGYVVLDGDGNLPTEDAIIDFSNPDAVEWYKGLLRRLLEMGVAAIKADFGEEAPLHGMYASGKSGFYEHNLYPLRYGKAVFDVTKEVTGDAILWGRSAWAGSQRYPLHWGGDAENTYSAMAASLRAGLSLGLCGFSFWSHDIGGFVHMTPEELYKRWLAFGMFTSHSRCHGAPPKEPWEYSEEFTEEFRAIVEVKYRLMPYVYGQAKECAELGYPMVRTLFFEYPDDPTSWYIEDQYLFGSDLLVAPLFEPDEDGRRVYLPPGYWIDYQTHRVYEGSRWHQIEAGSIPVIVLVRDGAVIPEIPVAQSTKWMDWSKLKLRVFSYDATTARGLVCVPGEGLEEVEIDVKGVAEGSREVAFSSSSSTKWRVEVVKVLKDD